MYLKSILKLNNRFLIVGKEPDVIQFAKLHNEIGEKVFKDKEACANVEIIYFLNKEINECIPTGKNSLEEFDKMMKIKVEELKNFEDPPLTKKEKNQIVIPVRRNDEPKYSRNEKCHCGSGKMYKHCCLIKQSNNK